MSGQSEAEIAQPAVRRYGHGVDPRRMALEDAALSVRCPGPTVVASCQADAEIARRPSGVTATALTPLA